MTAKDSIKDNDGLFVYETKFRIKYTTKNPAPIPKIIKSLKSLHAILPTIPEIIEGWLDVEIERGEFLIESIESGSLIEDIIVKLFFKDKEELDKLLTKIREKPMLRNTIAGLAVGALVTYGAVLAFGSDKPSQQITISNSTIVNVAASQTGLSAKEIEEVVKQATSKQRKKIAENAIDLVAPAKSDSSAEIKIFGDSDKTENAQPEIFRLTADQVASVPSIVNLAPLERLEDKSEISIIIRAVDLDSEKSGWKGKLEDGDEIVNIELDPKVNKANIYGKTKIVADATLIYTDKRKKNELKLEKIFIRAVH